MNPALAGAGSIMGLGVHLIDLLGWLVGREVLEVTALTDGPNERFPVEFLTAAVLRFDGGALAQITCSRRLPNGANSVTVYATGGRLDGLATLSMDPSGHFTLTSGDTTIVRRPALRDLYALEVEAFSRALQGEADSGASATDGVQSVAITSAVLESARTGRAVQVR
jgi:1,5-anhydro-D-fructose reductase (1,5-anhydro-D-mannitol-forming)